LDIEFRYRCADCEDVKWLQLAHTEYNGKLDDRIYQFIRRGCALTEVYYFISRHESGRYGTTKSSPFPNSQKKNIGLETSNITTIKLPI
jgi:hypothetical protein